MTPKHEQRRARVIHDSAVADIKAHLEHATEQLDRLRFATMPAVNTHETELCRAIAYRLRVVLHYGDSRRLVNPHLIRETSEGKLILIATRCGFTSVDGIEVPDGAVRSYRLDKIEGVRVTSEPFTFTTEG